MTSHASRATRSRGCAADRGVVMDTSWRPKTVDPLGQAFGRPSEKKRPFSLWLDLRTSEITFAQMIVVKLFYAVRRVVDEAGTALPQGAAVQGLLFDADTYDRADTIGQDLPIYVADPAGMLVNATSLDSEVPLQGTEIRSPTSVEELSAAMAELEGLVESADAPVTAAIALPAEPMLWAVALTGMDESTLQCLEGNEGA
jgi:hypothetical protein